MLAVLTILLYLLSCTAPDAISARHSASARYAPVLAISPSFCCLPCSVTTGYDSVRAVYHCLLLYPVSARHEVSVLALLAVLAMVSVFAILPA